MKQRQASVLEARSTKQIAQKQSDIARAAEKQGEAVMLFTIVTIIFLPLGTIAGIYGMNASEWDDGKGPKLEHLLKVLFGTSIPLAIAILYFAFIVGSGASWPCSLRGRG
jgi:Mg2+ and Co2+ transporter CorA